MLNLPNGQSQRNHNYNGSSKYMLPVKTYMEEHDIREQCINHINIRKNTEESRAF